MGGGLQEAGGVIDGGKEGEGEKGRTGSCESCKNLGQSNSSTEYTSCIFLAYFVWGEGKRRVNSRSMPVNSTLVPFLEDCTSL